MTSGYTRILVVKLSALGDLFHALPAVHILKIRLSAAVDWVTQVEYADLVRCFTDVDRVIAFPRHALFLHFRGFLSSLRRNEYDYIVDFQGLLKSAAVARLARGKRRIGPSFHREGSRFFYSIVAGERDKARHAVEQNLDIVSHLGLDMAPVAFPVAFPERTIDEPSPTVAIVPVSRWKTKNWPVDRFIEVARSLQEKVNASIFILGGPDDVAVCRTVASGLGSRVENLAGRTSLVETGSLLSRMDLLVCNDSGPMHMAAALGVPVLAVFGPTDPKRTGPYGEGHRVIAAPVPCGPCLSRKCALGAPKCIAEVGASEVTQVAMEMLARP